MTVNEKTSLRHGCIVMASGMGTRFGGNKLMAELGGKPLIAHVLDAVDGLFEQCVVVTRHEDVAAYCKSRGIQAILHDQPHRNDTVRIGMGALSGCDTVTFFQGDQPLIARESVENLLRAAESDPSYIWRVCWNEVPGAPVAFPSWTYPELLNLPASKGGGYVAKNHPERVHAVSVQNEFELFDVDTQEDLRVLQKHIHF